MHCSIIGTRYFNNRKLLNDILDLYYWDDPDLFLRLGGTSKVSRWAEEWSIQHGTDWNTRFEYWNRADLDTEFWLQCHVDLLIEAEQGIVFWDGLCQDTPMVFDIANRQNVPITVIECKFNETDFRIL